MYLKSLRINLYLYLLKIILLSLILHKKGSVAIDQIMSCKRKYKFLKFLEQMEFFIAYSYLGMQTSTIVSNFKVFRKWIEKGRKVASEFLQHSSQNWGFLWKWLTSDWVIWVLSPIEWRCFLKLTVPWKGLFSARTSSLQQSKFMRTLGAIRLDQQRLERDARRSQVTTFPAQMIKEP